MGEGRAAGEVSRQGDSLVSFMETKVREPPHSLRGLIKPPCSGWTTFGVGHAGVHQEGNCWGSGKKLIFRSHVSFAPYPPQIPTFLRQRLAWAWANREGPCTQPVAVAHPQAAPRAWTWTKAKATFGHTVPSPSLCLHMMGHTSAGVTAPLPLQLKRLAEGS